MLEPRRLAARAAAHRMAHLLGEAVGQSVGYRVRRDTRVGPATRIEVVTEGVLTRMILADPALEGTGLVIFDEFHERSVHADLGLALTLQSRAILRPDLRILVMSATLDGARTAQLLDGAPVLTSEGRGFPVETVYRPPRDPKRIEAAVASVVREAFGRHEGDILVFLPGAREIRRVQEALESAPLAAHGSPPTEIIPLSGSLPLEVQDRAIRPSPAGRRKVVLATAIAETSLTIEGVRVVVDSGLARVPRFSARTGMTRLATVRVTRASADQRRGRAGRLAPGICYRLWSAGEDRELLEHPRAEILDADLAPLALDLAAAGVGDPAELRWLDQPPAGAYAQARELLVELGALDPSKRLTAHGRRLAALPLHPRLAHMLVTAAGAGQAATAADIAALLGERDLLISDAGPPDPDLRLRLEALSSEGPRSGIRSEIVQRVRAESRELRRQFGAGNARADASMAGLVLSFAYPDRIGRRRPAQPGQYLLRNGIGATLPAGSALTTAEFLAAAELDGEQSGARILLAAPLDEADLRSSFAGQIEREDEVEWNDEADAIRAVARERLGAIVLHEGQLRNPDPASVASAVRGVLQRRGLDLLRWTDGASRLRARLAFLHRHDADWPDVSDAALLATLEEWIGPRMGDIRRRADLDRLDLEAALLSRVSWQQRAALDRLAPTHITVPSGSRILLDYGDADAPVLAVRLQEVFGMTETPLVAGGRVPVVMHLLSPARRPVQVTRDLAGFWRTTYFEVRKDLRGRYPKHAWPDDPLTAPATSRTRKRKS